MAEARSQAEWSRTASLLSLIANVHRDPKKSRPLKPADFMPTAERTNKSSKPTVGIHVLKDIFVRPPAEA